MWWYVDVHWNDVWLSGRFGGMRYCSEVMCGGGAASSPIVLVFRFEAQTVRVVKGNRYQRLGVGFTFQRPDTLCIVALLWYVNGQVQYRMLA